MRSSVNAGRRALRWRRHWSALGHQHALAREVRAELLGAPHSVALRVSHQDPPYVLGVQDGTEGLARDRIAHHVAVLRQPIVERKGVPNETNGVADERPPVRPGRPPTLARLDSVGHLGLRCSRFRRRCRRHRRLGRSGRLSLLGCAHHTSCFVRFRQPTCVVDASLFIRHIPYGRRDAVSRGPLRPLGGPPSPNAGVHPADRRDPSWGVVGWHLRREAAVEYALFYFEGEISPYRRAIEGVDSIAWDDLTPVSETSFYAYVC